MPKRNSSQLIAILGLCLAAVTLTPQATRPEVPSSQAGTGTSQEDLLVLKVKTRLVVVDVVARDKEGHVVPDLKADDFKVTEDGKQQKISVFSFQHPGNEPEAASAEEKPASDHVFRNKPTFHTTGALNIVLIDALNTTFLNQAYVRIEMVKFLERLPAGQPIAIYTMGRKLRLLQDFTTDLTQLKNVIQTMKGESSHVLASPTGTPEVPMTLQGIADQVAVDLAPQFRAQVQDFASQSVSDLSDERVGYTLGALSALARMLSGYPGRKNLIWLSESVPFGIYPDAKADRSSKDIRGQLSAESSPNIRNGPALQRQYVDQLTRLSNMMADAQVSVYPVDARGLMGSQFFNPANNVSGQGQGGGLAMKMEGQLAEELFQAHYNMKDIAEKTGGLAYYNRNDLDVAVREGMEDGSTYYTIGYYPQGKSWDGSFHKIQVSVNHSGVKLRHRAGYYGVDRVEFEKKHPEQRSYDLAQALNPDYPTATGVQFEAVATSIGAGKVRIDYAVDPSQMSFEQGPDGLQHAHLDCAARAFLPKNVDHPVKTDATRMDAALPPAALENIRKSYFPCQINLELPPARYLLRLVVRDRVTGLMGTVNAEVTVPDPSPSAKAEGGKH